MEGGKEGRRKQQERKRNLVGVNQQLRGELFVPSCVCVSACPFLNAPLADRKV